VNENHASLCASPEWAAYLQTDVLPPLTRDVDLGEEMLEIGPGPGAATAWLRDKVKALTAVESDDAAARELAARYAGTNVRVLAGNAADLSFPGSSFDSVGCFTMLHHVPTAALQNKVLAEALRVLRPGGVLVGSDSVPSTGLHDFHSGDVYNPVEPACLLARLQTLGFEKIMISVDEIMQFTARKPGPALLPPHAAPGEVKESGSDEHPVP
jgi:SAM-dependent methyltransferase